MNNDTISLSFNEKVTFTLRSLYMASGYSQYKMSKFEEYDLYARNKDFLISDSVITFTDTNGKLMALKPDVTLSIIKNIHDMPDTVQKVFYNENVYRISKGSHAFKEIMQTGLECFGPIDNYNISEVLTLAAKSLKTISESCLLDISHLGLVAKILDGASIPEEARDDILKFIGEKNIHELTSLCEKLSVSDSSIEVLKLLITTAGKAADVLPDLKDALKGRCDTDAVEQLCEIIDCLDEDVKNMLRIDFSVVSDMKYYNGIVFKGFIEGVPSSVISGGQYDKLMKRMKRKSGAIGFAVYLDMLDRLNYTPRQYDVDVMLTYCEKDTPASIGKAVKKLNAEGKSVFACKKIPENIKYRELFTLSDCEVNCNEADA